MTAAAAGAAAATMTAPVGSAASYGSTEPVLQLAAEAAAQGTSPSGAAPLTHIGEVWEGVPQQPAEQTYHIMLSAAAAEFVPATASAGTTMQGHG